MLTTLTALFSNAPVSLKGLRFGGGGEEKPKWLEEGPTARLRESLLNKSGDLNSHGQIKPSEKATNRPNHL